MPFYLNTMSNIYKPFKLDPLYNGAINGDLDGQICECV